MSKRMATAWCGALGAVLAATTWMACGSTSGATGGPHDRASQDPGDEAPMVDTDAAPLSPLTQVPPLFADLFVEGRRFTYAWRWRIDPHSDAGPPPFTDAIVTCTVDKVHSHHAAKVAEVSCVEQGEAPDEDLLPQLPAVWIVTNDGLWDADMVPESPEDLRLAVAETPLLDAEPEASSMTVPLEDEEDYTETWEIAPDGDAWCASYSTDAYYGRVERYCFAAGRGLTFAAVDGREGPSEETYTLQSAD